MKPYSLNFITMNDFVLIKSGVEFHKILLREIFYIERVKKYVRIITSKKAYLIRSSLNGLEKELCSHRFCRIHKCYIISMHYFTGIIHRQVYLGKKAFPLGRQYSYGFKEQLITLFKRNKTFPTHFDGDVDKLLRDI
jgi:DNA-binding LytR/AlgR family response regulator